MYYHVLIEQNSNIKKYPIIKKDIIKKEDLIKEIVLPYLMENDFFIDGYILNKNTITRFKISVSEDCISEIFKKIDYYGCFDDFPYCKEQEIIEENQLCKDVTTTIIEECEKRMENVGIENRAKLYKKVFIVHGHDEGLKLVVEQFLVKLGLTYVVLDEQCNEGMTIIEKFEKYAEQVNFCIVLYTPCDEFVDKEGANVARARQNVVFEHGYFVAKLGRKNVCALLKGDVEKPSDISGVLYIKYDNSDWKIALAKEMKNAGYSVDLNDLC